MKTFHALIKDQEIWLSERIVHYARRHGYAPDIPTLQQSWREAICGFSEPMTQMLKAGLWPKGVSGDPNHNPNHDQTSEEPKADPVVSFAREEARLHQERGVPLDQFIGLTKYYRRSYLDLVDLHFPAADEAKRYRRFVDLFFDQAEIGICAEWDLQTESAALRRAPETNRQLANEKNRYLTIFESLNEPVLILDSAQRLINLNLAANQLFDADAITGQAYYLAPDASSLNPQFIAMMQSADGLSEFEYDLDTRAGHRSFHVKVQRMLDVSEKFTGTVVILADITDFKAAQHASEAADRAKNAFLATMSHEIRTPINGILGLAQLLRDAPLRGRHTDYVEALLSSGEVLLDLVTDVLDYTKLEASEARLYPVVFSPRDMVERVVRLSMGEAERKGLTLDVTVADDCPPAVCADSSKIQRILLNLINNAVKFTPSGKVTVTLGVRHDQLIVSVQDTGPGIPPDDLEKVFTPFFQSSRNGRPPPVGTGLGLPICARLAGLIGGTLTHTAPRHGGAVFTLTCPFARSDTALPDTGPGGMPSRKLSILVVEDNPINAMVIDGFLASDGHRVDTVTDGVPAMQRLQNGAYDIALMDIRLDGLDGFEIIHQIRTSQDANIARLPILVLTADQSDATARRFARSGANAFQAKPLSREELRRSIWRVLEAPEARPPPSAAGHPGHDETVLNKSVIREHRHDIGQERTDRIVAAFTATSLQHKSALRAAADKSDRSAVADICHVLRSAAQMLGLMRLGSVAQSIEDAARGDDPLDLFAVSETLCAEVDTATAALHAFDAH